MSTDSSADAGYRTATATVATVQQTLDSTGTLEPVNQANLAFQVDGQVATVNVSVGQQVTAGQVLATLDTTSLEASVTSAQSSVTADEEKLSSDEASESSSSSTSTSTSTSSASGSAKGGTGNSANLGSQQTMLVADQHKADADSMQAGDDLAQANAACGISGSGGSGSGSNGGTSGAGGSSLGSGGTGGTSGMGGSGGTSSGSGVSGTGAGSGDATCNAALQAALADQQKVSQDQQTVARDEGALATLLNASSSSNVTTTPTKATTKTASATPAQVAADQATLDADEATMSEAEASLNQATLSSPISGTVVSVGVDAGQSVSAGSSSAQIMIMSPEAYEVSTTVSVSNVGQVKIGDGATVTLDGTTTPLVGTVTQIGPPPTGSSSTSYPVVISIPQALTGIHDGASVSVSIVVSQAKGVVAVPTSAVHLLSRTAYVTEIRNGTVQNVTVQVGTVGDLFTQVTSGVKTGDTVVLADMSTPLPSSNTTFPTIGGGLGGGGLGGGRFSGGGGAVGIG